MVASVLTDVNLEKFYEDEKNFWKTTKWNSEEELVRLVTNWTVVFKIILQWKILVLLVLDLWLIHSA